MRMHLLGRKGKGCSKSGVKMIIELTVGWHACQSVRCMFLCWTYLCRSSCTKVEREREMNVEVKLKWRVENVASQTPIKLKVPRDQSEAETSDASRRDFGSARTRSNSHTCSPARRSTSFHAKFNFATPQKAQPRIRTKHYKAPRFRFLGVGYSDTCLWVRPKPENRKIRKERGAGGGSRNDADDLEWMDGGIDDGLLQVSESK